jgi:hypothetical protein
MSMSLIPDTECARLAGFFDGEGYIGVTNKTGSMALVLNVCGLHRASIARFQEAFGGQMWLSVRANQNARPQWVWRCYGKEAQAALTIMRPYLIGKLPQADVALQFPVYTRGNHMGAHRITPEDRALRASIEKRLKELKREVA